jgi:hypothetical protein
MAPDSFESDLPASESGIAGQPETVAAVPSAPVRRAVRRSLFQIVCIEEDGALTASKA